LGEQQQPKQQQQQRQPPMELQAIAPVTMEDSASTDGALLAGDASLSHGVFSWNKGGGQRDSKPTADIIGAEGKGSVLLLYSYRAPQRRCVGSSAARVVVDKVQLATPEVAQRWVDTLRQDISRRAGVGGTGQRRVKVVLNPHSGMQSASRALAKVRASALRASCVCAAVACVRAMAYLH
jgi:hypothetical protein